MKIKLMNSYGNFCQLVILSEKTWEDIEFAIEKGNDIVLRKIIANEKERIKELNLEKNGNYEIELEKESVIKPKSSSYFMYNSLSYDIPKEQLMDMVAKFAIENNISISSLRMAVDDIDKNYMEKYQSQYDSKIRDYIDDNQQSVTLSKEEMSIELTDEERYLKHRENDIANGTYEEAYQIEIDRIRDHNEDIRTQNNEYNYEYLKEAEPSGPSYDGR